MGDGGGIDKMVSFEFAYDNPEFSDRVLQLEVTPTPLFCKMFLHCYFFRMMISFGTCVMQDAFYLSALLNILSLSLSPQIPLLY